MYYIIYVCVEPDLIGSVLFRFNLASVPVEIRKIDIHRNYKAKTALSIALYIMGKKSVVQTLND